MDLRVRDFLIELARDERKNYIHYQELCNACNLKLNMSMPYDRKEIGRILGEISRFEFQKKRKLLSALVLSTSFEEGDGFFKLCEELGMGNWRNLKSDPGFTSIQINECVAFWKNDTNYINYKNDVTTT